MNKTLFRFLGLLLCVGTLPALAGEGRIPVHTAPTVISDSGKYVLTRNLLPSPGNPSIHIVSAVVDLDLNGFTVDTSGINQYAIHIDGDTDVVIHNGSLVGGGIRTEVAPGVRRIVIEDVHIRDALCE